MTQKLLLKVQTKPRPVLEDSWIRDFKKIFSENKKYAQYWFWDHFNWKTQSLWIGKFNKINNLPTSDDCINQFISKIIADLAQYNTVKDQVYIKFYFSRNSSNKEPDINYLLICNNPCLPSDFSNSLANIIFEKYQITEALLERNSQLKNLIDHYINWNNYYTYYDLMGEHHS